MCLASACGTELPTARFYSFLLTRAACAMYHCPASLPRHSRPRVLSLFHAMRDRHCAQDWRKSPSLVLLSAMTLDSVMEYVRLRQEYVRLLAESVTLTSACSTRLHSFSYTYICTESALHLVHPRGSSDATPANSSPSSASGSSVVPTKTSSGIYLMQPYYLSSKKLEQQCMQHMYAPPRASYPLLYARSGMQVDKSRTSPLVVWRTYLLGYARRLPR